ncbi:hypothetical protein NUU61_006234 [Penicillium alfredii]|uniref:G-patch domain-containing protein n=1 Tax=Penicillium alfredii TaxID=1506179 RepID=A0A9W9K344_9EURO|nr:uncharacterized protein NUU61_006234 [Penicillium alfredii]KAJ5091364.1 hypothetical protein NUU61_006234 [Penicillium alfredii]
MDAQAYLIRHGWSGPGNPLNPNQRPGPHGGLGLTRPILVARKANNHGVGKKTTKDATNQWWLRGFEDALKGVGNDSVAASARSNNALTSELYRFFVRGEGLAGTIDKENKVEDVRDTTKSKSESKSKRKRDVEDDGADRRAQKKEEKAARKEEKRKRRKLKEDGSAFPSSTETSCSEKSKESKEERQLRRKEKKKNKESKKKAADSSAGNDTKATKKSKRLKPSAAEDDYPKPMSIDQEPDQDRTDTAELNGASVPAKEKKKDKKESREPKESKRSKRKESEATTDADADAKKKSIKDKKAQKAAASA